MRDDDAPWHLDPLGWPAAGSDAEKLRFALNYAVLAPSGHNTQPWRFRLGDAHADILADRSRRLPVVDPEDRALVISCGAAAALMQVALHRFGHAAPIEPLPDPAGEPDLLARIRLDGPAHAPDAEERRLFDAIPHRHTARAAYAPDPLPAALAPRLRAIAAAAGVEVALVEEPARRVAIAALVAEGDRIQFADPAFRAELADWVRMRTFGATDGISARGFRLPDLASPLFTLAVRHLDLGAGIGAKDQAVAAAAPALLALATAEDRPRDWLATGQAVGRMLLAATAAGVRAAFLNQPVEVPALRPRLRAVAGLAGVPQLLLRLGRAAEAPPSARRSAAEASLEQRPATGG